MKNKLRQFMTGRYGTDHLGRFTMGMAVACLLLYMMTKIYFFDILTWACLLMYYYRAMSRNVSKRYSENLKFLNMRNQFLGRFQHSKELREQKKIYRFYSCPGCHQKVRVPRGRGKIAITCPKCKAEFIRKS